jgi:DNA polymerase
VTLLYCDTETFSSIPIREGSYRYSEAAEVMLWTYAFDEEPPECWDSTTGEPMPQRLDAALNDPGIRQVWANGMQFDRVVIHQALGIDIPPSRIEDTMILALAHGLPGSLDDQCKILGIPLDQQKLKTGRKLIHLFCKPRPKGQKVTRATRLTHPAEWQQFIDYAKADILAMRAVRKRIPRWNCIPAERAYLMQDQRRNDRGVAIDLDLAQGALEAIRLEKTKLDRRARQLTAEDVSAASRRDTMLRHIFQCYGLDLPDLRGSTIERRLNDPDLPEPLKDLLRVRLDTCQTSTAKYKRFLASTGTDGRLRGTIQFCGANRTGRDAGRLVQLQNLPRPTLQQDDIDFGIQALKAGCADLVVDNVMDLCASALRGAIVAPEGKKLVIADLSNIEGRVLAWQAKEEWKIQAFRDFDAGIGPDLYVATYARTFNVSPETVDSYKRLQGKVIELFTGYQGSVGAFVTFAAAYSIDLDELADHALPAIPRRVKDEALKTWEWATKRKSTFDLSRRAYVACDGIKRLWREANPNIVAYWSDVENAFRNAILNPGEEYRVNYIRFIRVQKWLRVILPSGRSLCYPGAQVDEKGKIRFYGTNQYTKQWGLIPTYGGRLVENLSQSIARDIFKHGELIAEEAGYEVVMPVHDELVAEAPDTDEYSHEELAECMSEVPPWAEGLPLEAKGFSSYRYRKE